MYKMMTFNLRMELVDCSVFNNLEIAKSFAVFRNFGQTIMIIDTHTGKCVYYDR